MEPRPSMNFLSMIETRLIPRTNEDLDASFFFRRNGKGKDGLMEGTFDQLREREKGEKNVDQEGKEIVSRLENQSEEEDCFTSVV